MAVPHVAQVRTLPDVRGFVCFATCTCGWRGANHPSTPGIDPKARASDDMNRHLLHVDPGTPDADAG